MAEDRLEVLVARLRRLLNGQSADLGPFTWSALFEDTIAEIERLASTGSSGKRQRRA